MSFLSGEDMSIILAVQPRLGFGMWANMHLTGMHVEGKVKEDTYLSHSENFQNMDFQLLFTWNMQKRRERAVIVMT